MSSRGRPSTLRGSLVRPAPCRSAARGASHATASVPGPPAARRLRRPVGPREPQPWIQNASVPSPSRITRCLPLAERRPTEQYESAARTPGSTGAHRSTPESGPCGWAFPGVRDALSWRRAASRETASAWRARPHADAATWSRRSGPRVDRRRTVMRPDDEAQRPETRRAATGFAGPLQRRGGRRYPYFSASRGNMA